MKKLSIVIPVYNEENRIKETLELLFEYLREKRIFAEVIVADDGSVDNTLPILFEYEPLVKVVPIWPNRGKGYAVKAGVMAASGDYILFMDADHATDLSEIGVFLDAMEKEEADIIIGSRTSADSAAKRTIFRKLAGNVFHLLYKYLLGLEYHDTQCGFKIFSKAAAVAVFSKLRIERWAFDIEVLFLAKKYDFSVKELGVVWEDKTGSKVRMLRDASRMIRDILRIKYWNITGNYNIMLPEERMLNEVYQKAIPKKL